MKLITCICGHQHQCSARMSNVERAKKAARSRPRITDGKIDVADATRQVQQVAEAVETKNLPPVFSTELPPYDNVDLANEKVEKAVAATKATQRVPRKVADALTGNRMPGQPCEKHKRRFCSACN